ncbi:MAG: ABC transporter substrate-binding protein [Gemmatimonas sp.]|nr:ABC transporter substrate-binding protein [Gemmatimonas sp.]
MRLAVPDLISPSYFPAIAAVELGLGRDEGVDLELELRFPVTEAAEALRAGEIDFLACAAHAPLAAFPDWVGAKLLVALSQNTYWFLVVRSDLGVRRGDVRALDGLRIGAAPGPDQALLQLLGDAGVNLKERGIEVGPIPGVDGESTSFGVVAAEALAERRVDAFWANGMGAEVAVRNGTGVVVMDVRRGDGPRGASSYTFPALATTEAMIARRPAAVKSAVRAVVAAQAALRTDPGRAAGVGRRLFPTMEADLIADLIERDAPYYEPRITEQAVNALTGFTMRAGLLSAAVSYEDVVATPFSGLWT